MRARPGVQPARTRLNSRRATPPSVLHKVHLLPCPCETCRYFDDGGHVYGDDQDAPHKEGRDLYGMTADKASPHHHAMWTRHDNGSPPIVNIQILNAIEPTMYSVVRELYFSLRLFELLLAAAKLAPSGLVPKTCEGRVGSGLSRLA